MAATLTTLERWRRTVNFEELDRPVRFEAMGFWKETLARWLPLKQAEVAPGKVALESMAATEIARLLEAGVLVM